VINEEITGIHCLLKAGVDQDGRNDVIINNFEPARGIPDSIAWLSIPNNPCSANVWNRHVFGRGDARGGSHYIGLGDINGDVWRLPWAPRKDLFRRVIGSHSGHLLAAAKCASHGPKRYWQWINLGLPVCSASM